MNKKTIILAIVVIAVSVGLSYLIDSRDSSPQLIKPGEPNVGALSGPNIPFNYLIVGGIQHDYYSGNLSSTATTTPCAFQVTATSTLVNATAQVNSGSSTATILYWAKATTAYATTTMLANGSLSANAKGTFHYVATTTDNIDDTPVFAPTNWLVLGAKGGTGGGFAFTTATTTSYCQAEFKRASY